MVGPPLNTKAVGGGDPLWGALVQYDTVQSVIPAVFLDCGCADMVECMDRGTSSI